MILPVDLQMGAFIREMHTPPTNLFTFVPEALYLVQHNQLKLGYAERTKTGFILRPSAMVVDTLFTRPTTYPS